MEENVNNDKEGIATETEGREKAPDTYKKELVGKRDRLGALASTDKDSIWERGNEKRYRHRE